MKKLCVYLIFSCLNYSILIIVKSSVSRFPFSISNWNSEILFQLVCLFHLVCLSFPFLSFFVSLTQRHSRVRKVRLMATARGGTRGKIIHAVGNDGLPSCH